MDAFKGCTSLSSVDLGGVTDLGNGAFAYCTNLTSVAFPASDYTIGEAAFRNTGLRGSIDLSGVTEIGVNAFYQCSSIASVVFPDTPYIIGNNAFNSNTALSGRIDLGGVTDLGNGAFAFCVNPGLTLLLTSDSAPTFDEWWAHQVLRVYYPAAWGAPGSVQYLNHGNNARPNSVETTNYSFNAFTGTLTVKTNAGTAYSSADDDYEDTNWRHSSSGIDPAAVTSVIIQDGVTAIGNRAYMDCAGLTSVAFPTSAYTIGRFAFDSTGLSGSIDLGGVTEIGEGAFYVPANLTVILSGTTVPTFQGAWAYGVHRVYYPAAWGAPDSVTNLNYNSNAFAIIDIAAIPGVTAPVRGAAPVSAITETAQYTGTVTWSQSDSTFAANTVYTATVTLAPKTYYTLACVPENFFTVAGATSAANSANSGVITSVFPATAASPGSGGSGGDAPPADTTVYNAPSQSNATVLLSGGGLNQSDLLVTQPLTSGGNYNAFLKLADKDDILRVYDISLKSGKTSFGGGAHLTFDLGGEYAGQTFTLVHRKADGSFEYFFATADAKGNVKFGPLYELSPFMLVKGTLLYTPTHEVAGIPKTGDDGVSVWLILLFLSGICASLLLMRRREGEAGRVL